MSRRHVNIKELAAYEQAGRLLGQTTDLTLDLGQDGLGQSLLHKIRPGETS